MLKKMIFVTLLSGLFFSCGGSSSKSSSGSTTTATCSSVPKSMHLKSASVAHFKEMLAFPALKVGAPTRKNKSSNKKLLQNLKIVGNNTETLVPTGTYYCGASTRATGTGYDTIAQTNVVAIVLNGNTLCTGTLVTDDLILTAAHCFDDFSTNGDSPSSITIHFSDSALTDTNTTTALSWYRNPEHDYTEPGTYANVLNDIAWIKVDSSVVSQYGYSPVNVLANPQTSLSATEEKLSIGYGATSGTSDGDASGQGYLRCVSTYADSEYSSRGDVLPTGAVSTFDSNTTTDAYENYLTVIGPSNGGDYTSTSYGTCFGDSGGPTYVYRSGSWVLAALTQGSNSVLSPAPTINFSNQTDGSVLGSYFDTSSSASCSDGYGDYTTVGNYAAWLAEPSSSPCYGADETITTQ